MSKKFYVTTSIPYVNSVPHVGFAMEMLQGDVLARYHRLNGDNTFFLTGTDEHGVKIAEAADEQGLTPQELCDKNAAEFERFATEIGASNDDFIRTTSDKHEEFVRVLWDRLKHKEDLYEAEYKGLYCVGCEKFVTKKELIDGKCPIHPNREPEEVSEKNFFFKLKKYREQIRDLIQSDTVKVVPEFRKKEVLNMLKDIEDISVSRSKESYKWGVPVPGHEDQLMYVWVDALPNYMSGVDRDRYWPADVHVIGKDIHKFHAIYWIGMLLSAGYELPKTIMVHGFISSEGQKMSKSLGNVKDPFFYIQKYGKDALRFFLISEIPTLGDGDFSQSRFDIVYTEELANIFGNLISRVACMTAKYFEGKVSAPGEDDGWQVAIENGWKNYHQAFEDFNFKKAMEIVIDLGCGANKYIEDKKPWELAKTDQEALKAVLYNLLEVIRHLALMLLPVIPDSAGKMLKALNVEEEWNNLNWGGLQEGGEVLKPEILFPRIES